MSIHKLDFSDFEETSFELIAIHASIEAYRLAYLINQKLQIQFKLTKEEVQIVNNEGITFFQKYHFENNKSGLNWNLVQNRNEISVGNKKTELFLFGNETENIETTFYIVPEMKKIDFFIKIEYTDEDSSINLEKIIGDLIQIRKISTAYIIDLNKVKNKNNLIF